MLYSKNGSIPKPQTDDTEGWIEVPEPPVAGDGQEVVWWFPPGWVVRPLKPADEEGFVWDWSQSEEKWVGTPVEEVLPVITIDLGEHTIPAGSSADVITMGSAADTISMGSASDTISGV
jgi:hypothetical protein